MQAMPRKDFTFSKTDKITLKLLFNSHFLHYFFCHFTTILYVFQACLVGDSSEKQSLLGQILFAEKNFTAAKERLNFITDH